MKPMINPRYMFQKGPNKGLTLEEVMLSNFDVDENGCWNWKLELTNKRYGQISICGDRYYVHRLFAAFIGNMDVSKGFVCHKCDNPTCVNPDHLFVGSHQENMDDKVRKDRQSRLHGERNFSSRLSNTDVIEIKKLLSEGCVQRQVAHVYGVSPATICNIKRGVKWKSVN